MQSYFLGSPKFVARLCCILLYSVIFLLLLCLTNIGWSKGGAVVRALASHQYGPGWNPGFDSICWLSLLLVLSFAPRGFSPGTPVFSSPQKPTLPNSNSIWNARTRLNEFIWTLKCFVGKKAIYIYLFYIFLHFSFSSRKVSYKLLLRFSHKFVLRVLPHKHWVCAVLFPRLP